MASNLKKGDHVFLKHKSGETFEGDIKKIDEALESLTLENIISHPTNIELEGFRKFNYQEIEDIKRFNAFGSSSTVSGSEKPEDGASDELQTECLKISEDEYNSILKLQKEYRYIKACDNNYYEAINVLKNSSRIGFVMKDVTKGRLKRGSVVAASTNSHVFIFDIEVAGDRIFDKGMREILESKEIVKVVYDCRFLSDCLKQKHLVDLQNLLDVEANDVLLVHMNRGNVRKHTRSLSYLIELYIGLPCAVVDDEKFRDSWVDRPLEVNNQSIIVNYVSYLLPLQKKIEECYFDKMFKISDLYNNIWKRGDEIFSAGTGSKYTPIVEIKELLKKSYEVRKERIKLEKDKEL